MRAFFLAAGLAGFCGGAALAQDGLIIDRGRADRAAPGADASTREEAPSQAAIEAPRVNVAPFVLRSVSIEGATAPRAVLDAAVAPLLGQRFDGANLRQIAEAVANAYARSDVALYAVEIPEQDFSDGAVRIRVREGYVSAVSITGDADGDVALARHYAATLAAERPLTRDTMQRQLLLLSDIPGLETEVAMSRPDPSGGVRWTLELRRQPWEYEIGLNNSGSRSLGRTQLSATVIRNAAFRLGDETRLTLATDSEVERFRLAALSHRHPLGGRGLAVTGSIRTLRTEPEGGVEGRANAGGIVFTYPMLRSYARNLTLSFGLDGLNSDNAELGDITASERTRVLRGAAAYVAANARRGWVIGATLSQGLDAMDARSLDPDVTLNFTKLNLQLRYTRRLPAALVIRLAATGQTSGDPLPASERFSIGGAGFGRAFPAASASGDDGFGASAELGWRARRAWLQEIYAFADGGRVWTADRPLTPGVMRDIASAGAGVRLALGRDTRLDLEAAKAIDEAAPVAEAGGWRLRFGLATRF